MSQPAFSIVMQTGTPTAHLQSTELTAARRALAFLKGKIGGEAIQELLADDISAANTYWHDLLSSSNNSWTPIEAQAKALVDPSILNTASFNAWMAEAGIGYPNDLIAGHPEIWYEEEPSNVIQTWGSGPVTQFSHDPVDKQAFMLDLPAGWNTTATVSQTLRDGTSFSYAVSALREESDGFGIYFAVYLPSNAPKERFDGLKGYLSVECARWLDMAYRHATSQN